MRREQIVAAAREVIGTPYRRIPFGCVGVPMHCAKRLGVPMTDLGRFGGHPTPADMRIGLEENLLRIRLVEMAPGDVVWIHVDNRPQHLAVVGDYVHGGLSMIHAADYSGLNKVVEHRIDDEWRSRIVAVWRFHGVEA